MTDAETLREIRELLIGLEYEQQTIIGGKITIPRGDEARKFERVLALVKEWGGDGIAEQAEAAARWLMKNTGLCINDADHDGRNWPRGLWWISNPGRWAHHLRHTELIQLAK